MIQGFGFQINNIASNQNKAILRNSEANSKSKFDDILNEKSSREPINTDKSKLQKSDDIMKQQNSQASSRRVDIKNEQISDKPSKEANKENIKQEVVVSKEEKTIEELIANLSQVLAVFQNIVGINTSELGEVNLEELNLEISLEELENLVNSLENIIGTFDLGSSEQDVKNMIANLEKMIQDVSEQGEIEISAENFILELKEVLDKINEKVNSNFENQVSSEVKEPSNQLQDLINTIESTKNSKVEKKPLDNKLEQTKTSDTKPDIKVTTDSKETNIDTDIKVRIVTEKKDGINLFNSLGKLSELDIETIEEINTSIDQMPINILSNNIEQGKSQDLGKVVNNTALNPEQFMDIDKLDVLKQITHKVKADYENELNEIKIKLNPQHLGELTIRVSLERGILSARAFVENANIKQLLESNIDELKNSLKEQGVDFGSIDVSVGSDSNSKENNSNFFMNNRRVKNLKTKVENPVDMNYYEENENTQSSSISLGEGGVDITI